MSPGMGQVREETTGECRTIPQSEQELLEESEVLEAQDQRRQWQHIGSRLRVFSIRPRGQFQISLLTV
jgi:hypothetical protein